MLFLVFWFLDLFFSISGIPEVYAHLLTCSLFKLLWKLLKFENYWNVEFWHFQSWKSFSRVKIAKMSTYIYNSEYCFKIVISPTLLVVINWFCLLNILYNTVHNEPARMYYNSAYFKIRNFFILSVMYNIKWLDMRAGTCQ